MPSARPPSHTAAEMREIFDYDAETGVIRWRKKVARNVMVGSPAGLVRKKSGGRVGVRCGGHRYLRSRIAWAIQTGEWPPLNVKVDHRDRDKSNDRWDNLRLATQGQNCMNRSAAAKNISGVSGVTLMPSGRWKARIGLGRGGIHIGYFASKEDAIAARRRAERHYFGDFAPC